MGRRIRNGLEIRFQGGTSGRQENEQILVGIINGVRSFTSEGVEYLPVYVKESDQCLLVDERNIVEILDGHNSVDFLPDAMAESWRRWMDSKRQNRPPHPPV